MRRLALRLATLLVLSLSLAASPLEAQSTAREKAQARELYATGQRLFRQNDFEGAQRSFEEAYRAVPNPIVLLSIAECQVRLERYDRAIESLRTYLSDKPDAPDRAEVESQIEALSRKPGTLEIESNVQGATVYVDGQDSGMVTPATLELTGGEHTVALEQQGYLHAEEAVAVTPGGREMLRIDLTAEPTPHVAEPTPEPVEAPRGSGRHPTTAMWVATGVGAAGLVTGAILGGVALSKKSEFDDNPTEALADKGERLALFADVGFGLAAAGAVTALVLFLTSDHGEASGDTQAFRVAPAVSQTSYGLVGNLRF